MCNTCITTCMHTHTRVQCTIFMEKSYEATNTIICIRDAGQESYTMYAYDSTVCDSTCSLNVSSHEYIYTLLGTYNIGVKQELGFS